MKSLAHSCFLKKSAAVQSILKVKEGVFFSNLKTCMQISAGSAYTAHI